MVATFRDRGRREIMATPIFGTRGYETPALTRMMRADNPETVTSTLTAKTVAPSFRRKNMIQRWRIPF
jgi:hypothetical protein